MQSIHNSDDARRVTPEGCFPRLEEVTKPTVPTNQSAYYLDRKAQTLRIWAMDGSGPIKPLRINGRLAWPVADLKKLLGVA